MSKDLKIQVMLSAVDKLTAPFRSISAQAEKLASTIKQTKSQIKTLESQQRLIDSFKQTKIAVSQGKQKAQGLAQQELSITLKSFNVFLI